MLLHYQKNTYMKSINLSIRFVLFFALLGAAFSCKKPGVDSITDEGQTIVKLAESDYQLVALDLVNTSQAFTVDLRRDVPNESELNKPLTVVLTLDPTVLTAYNTAHSTSYVQLPTASYTLDQSTPISGNNITVTFAPGEFAKNIRFTVPDATVLDPNDSYALGFKIASAEGAKISSELNNLVTEVGLKNKYDGVYRMTGTLVDVASSGITAKSPTTVHLVTIGERKVQMYNAGTSSSGFLFLFPILNAGAESAYGGFLPEFEFDANDRVVKVVNAYGQPNTSNTRSAEIDPSGVNKWENGVLRVKFFMYQPNTVASGPRTSFDLVFQYTGPR